MFPAYLVPTGPGEVLLQNKNRTIMASCTCKCCRQEVEFDYCAATDNEDHYLFLCPNCGDPLVNLLDIRLREAEELLGRCR